MPSGNSRLTRRRFVQAAGGATTLTVLGGCLGDDDDDDDADPGDEETYIEIALQDDPRTIDPVRHLSTPDRQVLNSVFDNIIGIDGDLGFIPEVAASMPETERDGERWIVEIDEDATFHNGDPVTADDIEYSMTQPVVEERGDAGDYAMIDEVTHIDDHTVQFDLDYPFARFMLSLNTLVVPGDVREDNKGDDGEWHDNIVGCGPYQLVDWLEGERVTLEAWDDYWGPEVPNIDEVVFNEVEESSTRVTTLETGENDLIDEVPGDLFGTVEGISGASLSTTPGLRCNFIAFNCIDGPTADPRVREAIDYCIDLEAEVETHHGDAADRMYSPIPPILAEEWDFPIDEWAEIPRDKDIEQAQALFEEADVDPDYQFDILVSGADREDEAISIANGIEEAGYTAQVTNLEWGTFISTFNTGDADDMNLYLLGLSGSPDPGAFVYTLYHQDREGADNGHYYRDEELTEWIDTADQTDDFDERRELYTNAITRVLEQRVHLPTHVPLVAWGVSDVVEGYEPHPRPSVNPRITSHDGHNLSVNR